MHTQFIQKEVPHKGKKNKEKMGQIGNIKMINLNLTIPPISLNVIGLNIPVKRQRFSDWI